jgi:hypothetical protein
LYTAAASRAKLHMQAKYQKNLVAKQSPLLASRYARHAHLEANCTALVDIFRLGEACFKGGVLRRNCSISIGPTHIMCGMPKLEQQLSHSQHKHASKLLRHGIPFIIYSRMAFTLVKTRAFGGSSRSIGSPIPE